MLNQKNTQMLN